MSQQSINIPTARRLETHTFTPRFQMADEHGLRPLAHPVKSKSELAPIQVAIDIPQARLGKISSDTPLSFNFVVKQRRIMVYPDGYTVTDTDGKQHTASWYGLLNEQERLAVFNYILAEYRHRAHGNDGFRVAAIGITEHDEMFIASNTRPTHQIYKKCAETSVISAAIETAKKAKHDPKYAEKLKSNKPKVLFKDFVVMGGKDASSIHIACPCGPCTDEIYDHMALKGEERSSLRQKGNIYVLPCPAEITPDAHGQFPIETPKINDRAKNLGELKQGECWKVTPEGLYRIRNVTLKREAKRIQTVALGDALAAQITPSQANKIAITDFLAKHHATANDGKPDRIIDAGTAEINPAPSASIDPQTALKLLMAAQQAPESIPASIQQRITVALQSATNAMNGRNSVAELDASALPAPDGSALPDFRVLNRFMSERINDTLIPRVQTLRGKGTIIDKNTIGAAIPAIRCVVIQLEDGSFSYGVEVKSTLDPAMPNAEFGAFAHAVEKIEHAKVKHMWVMEMNPERIKYGEMPTPQKDSLERTTKRSHDPHNLEITMIPYNNGSEHACDIAQKNAKTFPLFELYPNMYSGRRHILPFTPALPMLNGNGNGHGHSR